ncbi:MAG: TIGR01777 family oxidoreductase [Bacteroidia bacterium]
MKSVLITGGTGLIGRHLSEKLLQQGYTVHLLSRQKNIVNKPTPTHHQSKIKIFQWDFNNNYIDPNAFENVGYVIHLTGANIAKRWTPSYKKTILTSRIKTAELLINTIIKNNISIEKFVGASAIGYYGMKTDEKIYTEVDAKGNDFLADTCHQWEKAYDPLIQHQIPTAIVRIGLVLSANGGIYKLLKPVFQMGLGSAIGSGKQYMPWIHIDDLCRIFIHLMTNKELQGIYNAVSDEILNNAEFSKKLAQSLNAPFFLPNIPEWALKMILGEQHQMLTTGLKISNEKIKQTGFVFRFSKLSNALADIQKNNHSK